ncbi:MAG: hypothetical protein SFW07_01790 [Gammaproteobacteria bacterium]|nr:hypothetical protein [Gammaproteobacteria bacterium]
MANEKTTAGRPEWITHKNVQINAQLFYSLGILALTPQTAEPTDISSHHIPIGTREISAAPRKTPKKFRELCEKLNAYSQQANFLLNERATLSNPRREDEIFVPFVFKEKGMYLYPWLSSNKTAEIDSFSGFQQFVTAGCLFGPNIIGTDQDSSSIGLIKHNIHLKGKISSISYDTLNNPYLESLIDQFECFCEIVTTYAEKNSLKKLLYHMPTWDYILFGIELFIRGAISLKALTQFFSALHTEANLHKITLEQIARAHDIELTFISPFDNLFGNFFTQPKDNLCELVFQTLQLSTEEVEFGSLSTEEQKVKESSLVKRCAEKLCKNRPNSPAFRAWNDFLVKEKPPENLEELFKIANSTVIGIAAADKKPLKTCSLLPLSEKQIQVSYQAYSKKQTTTPYGSVLNLTGFDPLLTYTAYRPPGLVFYFTEYCKTTAAQLIRKKGLLAEARRNIARIAHNQKPISLEEHLQNAKSSETRRNTK